MTSPGDRKAVGVECEVGIEVTFLVTEGVGEVSVGNGEGEGVEEDDGFDEGTGMF